MDIIDKIIYSIEKEIGLNQVQLADKLQVTPQTITKWKARKKIPDKSKYYLITELGISEKFLETGKGPFFESENNVNYETEKTAKTLVFNDIENKYVKNTQPSNILHIPAAAEAGFMGGGIDPIKLEDVHEWHLPGLRGNCYSFDVKGDSMMDTLRAGEMVITSSSPVQNLEEIVNDYLYVVETNDGFVVKRVSKHLQSDMLWMHSDNEDYKDYELHFSEIRRMFKARRIVSFNLSHKMRYE